MGMQVCGKFHFLPDIGLHQGFPEGELIILGLAHEGLGDGGDHGIDLDLAVRVDVRQLGAVEPEDIDPLTVALDVAGDPTFNDPPSLPERGLLAGDGGQIVDEVVRLMVNGMDRVGQHGLIHPKGHHNVLFLVEIQFSKIAHIITHFSEFEDIITQRIKKRNPHNEIT